MTTSGRIQYRFAFLLAALVVLIFAVPVMRSFLPGVTEGFRRVTLSTVWSAMLLFAVFAISRSRTTIWIGMALVVPAIVFGVIQSTTDSEGISTARHLFRMAFVGYAVVIMLRLLFTTDRVTVDTICASLCVYLLLGVLWASAYSLLGVVKEEGTNLPLYYSFVTLTTLGYGDITPKTDLARMLSVMEALTGQLYLAVLVARLVALHIVHSQSSE